ncbi:hypothetical protein BH10PSE12_BH10PSE12_16620 [soil metagenome]
MAKHALNTSRRSLVAALALTPIIIAAPAIAASGRAPFEALIAAQKANRAIWDAHPFSSTKPGAPDHDRLYAEDVALMHKDCDALDAIILFPAPDHRAIVQKLEIITKEWMMDGGEDRHKYLEAIAADVRRLGGVA